MSGVPYVGTAVFPTSITVPKGGEPATSASVNVAIEGNRDATVYLKAIADAADGQPLRNLRAPAVKDAAGNPLAFAHTRADGTSTGFFSLTANLWIKCGINTAGTIVVGDAEYWQTFATGAAGAVKTSFGCDSAVGVNPGRIALFNADLKTTGGGVDPKYLLDPASGDITGTWTTRSLDTIGSFTSFVNPYDCVVTPTQRVIVVGGGDPGAVNRHLAWKSDDFGFSFTRVVVGASSGTLHGLTRVIVGKAGRLVAWEGVSSVFAGDKLWYSDDNGNTWSSRSAIGFDTILDGAYLPDLDLWAFATASAIYTTPNPAVSAFTSHGTGTISAMGGFSHYVMYAQHMSAVRDQLYLNVDGFAGLDTQIVGRAPTLSGAKYVNVAAAPFGQFLLSTNDSLTLTGRV